MLKLQDFPRSLIAFSTFLREIAVSSESRNFVARMRDFALPFGAAKAADTAPKTARPSITDLISFFIFIIPPYRIIEFRKPTKNFTDCLKNKK